jgi:hypothetical protein
MGKKSAILGWMIVGSGVGGSQQGAGGEWNAQFGSVVFFSFLVFPHCEPRETANETALYIPFHE